VHQISRKFLVLYLLCFVIQPSAYALQETPPADSIKKAIATPLNDKNVDIDGVLEEDIWREAVFISGFTQREPFEGQSASSETQVAFVYDDQALYVGARMRSTNPEEIRATVTRRDQGGNTERIIVSFDTYLDHRTAYSFSVSPSGVRRDYFHPSDNEFRRDFSYDPVWVADAHIDSAGWTAEMRIPFSQLRFADKEKQLWGLNVNRFIPNKNEDAFWILVPRDETGWASRFGLLDGISGVVPKRRIEIIPYLAGSAFSPGTVDPDNPFLDDMNFEGRTGGDLKIGIGPNLTLDATVNPDFGQVEADPAVVNLSVFEAIFPERRPFFTEGSQLFDTRGAEYFFSRRIGGPPSFTPSADFVDEEQNTSILGASKLTGRLQSGLSVGGLFAATANENTKTFDLDTRNTENIDSEPFTTYSVLRLQQEFGEDASTAGIILTGVQRSLNGNQSLSDILNEEAYSGGADWNLRFAGGTYELSGDAGFSHVQGSEEAILRLQQSSARYFQRPDADYVSIDSSRTALTGFRGSLEFEKNAGEHWLWEIGGGVQSPEFELNDIGILRRTDEIFTNAELTFRENTPGLFYTYRLEISTFQRWNFGGDHTSNFNSLSGNVEFYNFWNLGGRINYQPRRVNQRETRGGPLMGSPEEWRFDLNMSTNRSAQQFGRLSLDYQTDETGGWQTGANAELRVLTSGRIEYSISPRYSQSLNRLQYIETLAGGPAATFGNRYVFADLKRSTASFQFRMNYSFNPDLSLEVYAEPFVSSGKYDNPGELSEPKSIRLNRYNVIEKNEDGDFVVEQNQQQFVVNDPDFLVRSFRSNVVLRYEWRPGSLFFLVWQQNRSENLSRGTIVDPTNIPDVFGKAADNFFSLKFTYWLPVS